MGGNGYTLCEAGESCPGGFVCVNGVCAPQCTELDPIARVEPGSEDRGAWECSAGASCQVVSAEDTGLSYLETILSQGDFLQMGPGQGELFPEGCEHLLLRVSVLARPEDAGREMTSMVIGNKFHNPVWGVAQDIVLRGVSLEEVRELALRFRESTYFYVVSTETFGWPIQWKLLPAENESMLGDMVLGVREFNMYCCQSGSS